VRTLDSESLAHDWAATGKDLKVGHATTAWGGIVGRGGGKRAESGGRGFLEERAHGTRLTEKSLHNCELIGGSGRK
jgi:hypothetical protein